MRCSVNDEECVTGRLKRGMCELHYRRQRTRGTTDSPRIDNLSNYSVNESGCWVWQGAKWKNGYGKLSVYVHGTRLAHRAFYIEHVNGGQPLPERVDVDHCCHNADTTCERGWACQHRPCVNPEHLEAVTHRENLRRGKSSRTTCENGLHDLTMPGATRPGTNQCTECWRVRYRAAGRRYRSKV